VTIQAQICSVRLCLPAVTRDFTTLEYDLMCPSQQC